MTPETLNHNSGIFLVFLDTFVHLHERLSANQTNHHRNRNIECQFANALPVIVIIHACYALTHGIHGVREGQEFVNILINLRQSLYRESTTGTCHLNYHNHNRQCLADVSESDGQGINQ